MGNEPFWTKDRIEAEAAKYTTVKDFRTKSPNAYNAATRYGLTEDVTSTLRGRKIWTPEKVMAEAAKHTTLKDFRTKSKKAYSAANRLGCLHDVTKYLAGGGYTITSKPTRKRMWTDDKIKAEAAKYDNRQDFRAGNIKAYDAALRYGLINDLFKSRRFNTESFLEIALAHGTIIGLMQANQSAYRYAQKHKALRPYLDLLKQGWIVEDIWQDKWRIREIRHTQHGFDVFLGYRVTPKMHPGRRIIITTALAKHIRSCRPKEASLPLTEASLTRIRKRIGASWDYDKIWQGRASDLLSMPLKDFAQKYNCSISIASMRRTKLRAEMGQ